MPEPKSKATFHRHPKNMHDAVYGVKLLPGDILEPTDKYDSSNGFWETCTCPGNPIGEGVATIWIRPLPEPKGTIRVQNPRSL